MRPLAERLTEHLAQRAPGKAEQRARGQAAQPAGGQLARPAGAQIAQPAGEQIAQPAGEQAVERDGDQHLPGGTAAPSTSALEALPPMVSQRLSPSLAERLSRLSVRSPVTGGMRASCSGALSPAQALGPAAPSAHRDAASLAACTGGVLERGGFITLRTCIPLPLRFGRVQVDRSSLHPAHLHALGLAAANAASDVLFIDTETTGLSGGTGTLPFLIGAARIDGRALAITQWLLADFAAEAAVLDVFGNAVRRSAAIATYNGKSFDVPLLRTRLVLWRRPDIFEGIPHADLLHWSRRMAP